MLGECAYTSACNSSAQSTKLSPCTVSACIHVRMHAFRNRERAGIAHQVQAPPDARRVSVALPSSVYVMAMSPGVHGRIA